MILSELKKQVDFLCDTGHGDNLVLVTLSESSIGSRAATGITGIHSGIDLEHGQVRISTEKKIISYGKDRDEVIEPRREDYNIGLRIRHLLFCPKCDTQLRKDDYYCSHCGQRINNKGRDVISKVEDLFLAIEEKARIEEKSTECVSKLKMSANNLNLSDLNDCSYEECRDLFRQIKYYIDDENIAKALSDIIENKKIEKYPELLRPTYYPEIDSLDIPDSEKIRLDKAVRWNIRNRMTERNAKKMKYPLSMKDLELLKSIGIVEKSYNFRCKNCGSTCTVISESSLEKYRRFWELFELEKQKKITSEQLNELDQLDQKGFYEIYICCMDGDECDDVEITNEKELSDYMQNVEVIYKVVKDPDLTYEKL